MEHGLRLPTVHLKETEDVVDLCDCLTQFDTTTSCCARTCSCHSMVAAWLETAARMCSVFDKVEFPLLDLYPWFSATVTIQMGIELGSAVCISLVLSACSAGVGQAQLQRK